MRPVQELRAFAARWRVVLRAFQRDRGGAVAITSSIAMVFVIGCMALAIDLGALYVERRQAQGAVDLAAVIAAADIPQAQAAARATLDANGLPGGTLAIDVGNYAPDPNVARQQRFVAGAQPANAVRVTFAKPGKTFFARAFNRGPMTIRVSAIASTGQLAMFSVGSRLAALRGGVVNQLLGTLLGGNVSLSVADYNALAAADISLLPFMQALATQVGARGTYGGMLSSSAQLGQILSAMATVADSSGQTAAVLAINSLSYQVNRSAVIALSRVIDAGPLGSLSIGSQPTGFNASLKAMDVLSASALALNSGTQVSVNLTNLSGIASVTLDVALGQSAQTSGWAAIGQPGATVYTAQARVRLTVQVGGSGVLAGAAITLPIALDVAYARGRLVEATCTARGAGSVTVAATPGVAQLAIAATPRDMTDFSHSLSTSSATLVSTLFARVRGTSYVNVGNLSETNLTFAASEIGNGTIKRTDTRDSIQSLFTSLLRNLSLSVDILGFSLATPTVITDALAASIAPVASTLDDTIYTILTTLGLHIGEADVAVQGVKCSGAGQLSG